MRNFWKSVQTLFLSCHWGAGAWKKGMVIMFLGFLLVQTGNVQIAFSQGADEEEQEPEVPPVGPVRTDEDSRSGSAGTSGSGGGTTADGNSDTAGKSKSTGDVVDDLTGTALKDIAEVLSIFISILTFLSLLILDFGGTLIGTDMITGQEVMEAIRPMWVIVRNLTNIGFVVVLLFLAFANLFTFGEGSWTIKEKLPRVIMALIAINFSLLTFKVVIDAVHVGTISLLSISDTALQAKEADGLQALMDQKFDKTTYKTCTGSKETGCLSFKEVIDEMFCTEKNADGSIREDSCLFRIGNGYTAENAGKSITANNESSRNLFLAFGVFFQHLERLPMLSASLKDWHGVLDNVLFSGIMALAFMVALVCVFLALLVRVAILWVAMIFSPLIFAGSIMGLGDKASTVTDMIFKALIMPLKIAGAFAVTFVMLTALADVNFSGEAGDLVVLGPALSQFGKNSYAILWQIMTVVIFWKVAFWALADSPISGMIIDKIRTGAETAGGYIAKTATVDQTIIPVGTGGAKIGLSTIGKFPEVLSNIRGQRLNTQEEQFRTALDPNNPLNKSITSMKNDLEANGREFKNSDKLIEFLRTHGLKVIGAAGPETAKKLYDFIGKEKLPGVDQEKFVKELTSGDETRQRKIFENVTNIDKEKLKKVGLEKDSAPTTNKKVNITVDATKGSFTYKVGEEGETTLKIKEEENIKKLAKAVQKPGVEKPSDEELESLMREFWPTSRVKKDEEEGRNPLEEFKKEFFSDLAKSTEGETPTPAASATGEAAETPSAPPTPPTKPERKE